MEKKDKQTLIQDMGREQKTTKFSKKIVVCSVSAIILFFVAETYLLNQGMNSYPDVFIASWFSFWGVELFNLSRIKINEDKMEIMSKNNPYKALKDKFSDSDGSEDDDRENAVG
jgi:hypothetical protein